MPLLTSQFFARHTLDVAKDLLGKIIIVNGITTRIVEVEAYRQDKASHAYTKTPRSQIMYDTYGHIYVYFIYGMYNCLNFTTEPIGKPGAILIRALEPLTGIEKMKQRRNTRNLHNLCSGPGKLCQALNITKTLNHQPLNQSIKIYDDGVIPKSIGKSPRIGIKDATQLHWRFFIKDNKFVSKVN